MTADRIPIAVIKDQLQARVPQLVTALCPGMRRTGNYWQGPNPTRAKDSKTSFTVWSNGAWKEYDSDEKGDVLDLIAYARRCSRGEAIAWAKDFLGLRDLSPAERARMDAQARAKQEKARAAEAEERAAKQRRAFDLWLGGRKLAPGSLAWRYLASRSIAMDELVQAEGDLKDSATSIRYWGPREPGFDWLGPAMLAPIRQAASGEITGVHATFIETDGSGKAPVPNPKLMLGTKQGGFVRLTRGKSGLPFEDLAKADLREPLLIGEGIETCLSAAIALPDVRVWAALDLGNMASLPALPCIGPLVILKENDTKPQALEQRQKVMDALADKGFDVREMVPAWGNDFNDTLRG
jgi:hypothetical protein